MLLTNNQVQWLSTLTDNCHLLMRYFQLNAKHIVQRWRREHSRHRVNITRQHLKRRSPRRAFVLKYFRLRIRGGLAVGHKRIARKRVWKYYGSVFFLRMPKKGRKVASRRKKKGKDKKKKTKKSTGVTKPEATVSAVEEDAAEKQTTPPVINNSIDDTEFVYYQSSDEDESCAGIISSSVITTPNISAVDDNEMPSIDTNFDDIIESGVQSPASSVSHDVNDDPTNDATAQVLTTSVEHNDETTLDNDDGIALSDDISRSTRYSNDSTVEACDVSDRLRQQLELLKKGKGELNLLGTKPTERATLTRSNSVGFLRMTSRNSSSSNGDVEPAMNVSSSSTPTKRLSNESRVQCTPVASTPPVGFMDSLINKIKSAGSADRPYQTRNVRLSSVSVEKKRVILRDEPRRTPKTTVIPMKNAAHVDKSSPTVSCASPEFFGFDNVLKTGDLSALLPTPRARNSSDKQSVFVSEELDAFMKENALDNVANVSIPSAKQPYDEALLTEDAEPPAMKVPQRPDSMERPRTLAEKRMLFETRKDIRFLMIENESTIYHELRKRRKEGRHFDNSLLRGIINGNIPSTRDCWRAMCWLNTDHNRFFFQIIDIGDVPIKTFGGLGNNKSKILCKIATDGKKEKEKIRKSKQIKCGRICTSLNKLKINNFDEYYWKMVGDDKKKNIQNELDVPSTVALDDSEPNRKFNLIPGDVKSIRSKPGPLCSKVVKKRTSVDVEYGPYQSFRLPTVQLEVWPQLEKPLPDPIQPYMKYLLPHANITDEWAKFAVCAVKAPHPRRRNSRKYKKLEDDVGSFVFDIPYVNDQKRILVRKRRMHNHWEVSPLADDYMYEFAKDIDQTDTNAVECADILSQMITSVAITAHENGFVKQDPDLDYVGKIVPITKANAVTPGGSKTSCKAKISPSAEGSNTTKNKIM